MILIFSAPSGSGKSTLIHHLLGQRSDLEFSISCTTRPPRGDEQDGKDYFFISEEQFLNKVQNREFVEYENVYTGIYYGTLHSEIARIEGRGHHVVFDVDVKGGMNLKRIFGERALSIFIAPPSLEELRRRLVARATDSMEKINERLAKANQEMSDAPFYDILIVNDQLQQAVEQLDKAVTQFLNP